MPRSSVPKLILVMLTVLTLLALEISINTNGQGENRRPHRNPYGAAQFGFGGYQVAADATEVGAQWKVPTIARHSYNGGASTWIGVQSSTNQFIQLGTTENNNNTVNQYEVFWSDVTVNFHPQRLLVVAAGDDIDFAMEQVPRGWRLHFDDVTNKVHKTITIPYAQGSPFNIAEWLQEDPTFGGLANHVAYPTIATPTFLHLTLNHVAPSLDNDERQVLSTVSGVNLIPTNVSHDAFGFKNATGPARQYLVDVFAFNSALYPFQVDVYEGRSPSREVLHSINATLATLVTNLTTQQWPRRLSGALKGDVRAVRAYARFFATLPVAPAPLSANEIVQIDTVSQDNHPLANTMRRALGLPPEH